MINQMGLLCNLNHKITSNIRNEAGRTHVSAIDAFSQKDTSLISKCAAHLLVQAVHLNGTPLLQSRTCCGL